LEARYLVAPGSELLIIILYLREVSITGKVRAVPTVLLLLGFDLAKSSRLRFWPLKMLLELSMFEICAQVRDIEVIISLSLPLALGF